MRSSPSQNCEKGCRKHQRMSSAMGQFSLEVYGFTALTMFCLQVNSKRGARYNMLKVFR